MLCVRNQFKLNIMKRTILTLAMILGIALMSFSQLYLGYSNTQINSEIQSSLISSITTENNDGTYNHSVVFNDGHYGVYIYKSESNICVLYMLGYPDETQYKAVVKEIKKNYKKSSYAKNTWIKNYIGYLGVISTFEFNGDGVIAVYPAASSDEIPSLYEEIEETLSDK
jgi:hypothetical protein